MLDGLRAILDFISSVVSSLIAFFGLITDTMAALVRFVVIMPVWLSGLILGVATILVVKLIVGRT